MKLKPSLQNVEVEGEIPRLVEYYENLLQTQKSHMKQMEQEIRLIRSNQQNSNSSVNEMLKDLNEYLCKILLSLKTKLSTQIKQIRELKPKTSSKFDLYEELNHKYPGPELLPCLETQIKENLALFEDPESCLKCIQEITKEIIQGIEEISKGCKNLEFIKQAPLKGKSQTDVNIKDNEGLYRIITFLLKMLCFQNGKTMSLEQEAEGNEKIRIYQEKFKGFLIALYGKEARIIVDIERKIDLYLKTPNPLDLEKGLEIPLLKTLSYLRKYSNNTFQDEKEEECIEIKMNERQNTQDSLKSLNSINNSSRILKESHRSMKDLINSKTQQRLLLEKQEIDYSKEGKLCKEISNFEPNLCKEISNFEQNLPIPHKKNSNTKNSINFQTSDIENNKIESSKSIIKEIKTDEIINIDEKNMNFNQEKFYKDIDFIATKKNDDKVFVNTTDIQDFNGDQPKQMSVFDNSINNYSKKCFSPETQNSKNSIKIEIKINKILIETPINKLKSLSTVDNSKKDIYKLKDVTVNDSKLLIYDIKIKILINF